MDEAWIVGDPNQVGGLTPGLRGLLPRVKGMPIKASELVRSHVGQAARYSHIRMGSDLVCAHMHKGACLSE